MDSPEAVSGHNSLLVLGSRNPEGDHSGFAVVPRLPQQGVAQLVASALTDFFQVRVVATLRQQGHIANQEDGDISTSVVVRCNQWGVLWHRCATLIDDALLSRSM